MTQTYVAPPAVREFAPRVARSLWENVVLENNRIEDSVFAAGAALQIIEGSTASLEHVSARNNEAIGLFFNTGGAIQIDSGSTMTINHSAFEGESSRESPRQVRFPSAEAQSAISGGSQTTISHSRFTGNQVDGGNAGRVGGVLSRLHLAVRWRSIIVASGTIPWLARRLPVAPFPAVLAHQAPSPIASSSTTPQSPKVWPKAVRSRQNLVVVTLDHSLLLLNRAEGDTSQGGGIYKRGRI